MTRTVLIISNRDGVLDARIEKSAPPLPRNWNDRVPFGFGAAALPLLNDSMQLEQYGNTLAMGLRQHPAIAQVLQQAFNAAAQQSHSLCFVVEADEGRQIRWETLRDDRGHFVALDGRCHIGRIVRSVSAEDSPRLFTPPLRLLAFLSGVGLDATEEWGALATAFDEAHARGLPVKAEVRIGQTALLAQAQGECDAGLHPAINVRAMPANGLELEAQIRAVRPHILHFFCHGKAAMGAAFLELANAVDHVLPGRPGSISLAIDTLAQLEGLRDTWLVVLNCCEGGQSFNAMDSMAERLVSEAGLAAAIGMLEPVAVGEASRFCAVLYPELFYLLEGVLNMLPGALPQRVDLSPAMSRPRRALRDLIPPLKGGARWTLPVLYQQEQPFQVFRPLPVAPIAPAAPAPALDWAVVRAKTETVAGMLAGLPPDTPAEVRDRMLALLDEAPVVPAALRPDRWGRFGQEDEDLGG
ncbi:CHAT domain-containing protein [Paraburkholderia sp. CNPSo 3076]|uniref:CHAT domain-containing protein n=1 Tax=Paraburkholderia sp. CNPSo 3076 TaxID=2940936 RepID=UPI002254499D|nr:CHAT domain-containing protein [Paraburkholderia sp. CNPSo 3076]MCX5542151.1 CHAT domain-containing protein [Paraburkholderia sp. CNPSo 3076]